jgi:hypothetical protein
VKLLDNGSIMLTKREFDALLEYSYSLPTGTTPGKAWKSKNYRTGEWKRGVFGKPYPPGHEYHGQIPIGWRTIVVEGAAPYWPIAVRIPPPPLCRGLP